MGIARLGYVILTLMTAIGVVGFLYSKFGGRPRRGPTMFVLFLLGVVGLLFWGIFLSNLQDTLTEAISDGQYQQQNYEQERLAAKYQNLPPPEPNDIAKAAFTAMDNAKRSARLFGWDWRKLLANSEAKRAALMRKPPRAAPLSTRPSARPSGRPSNR